MKLLSILFLLFVFGIAAALADDETVPTTVEKGSSTIKEGGQDIGEGFKGIGRGIRDVFTGERSKEDFKEGKKIGTGVVDVGRGVGGVGRGTGREVKEGFKGSDPDTQPAPEAKSKAIEEENLPE